jgi:methyltransferase (TIGR00027 family)
MTMENRGSNKIGAMSTEPLIRNISDTALWVAVYRARESERPDAVFHDPFARKLAGDRGEQIAQAQTFSARHSWSFIARTWLIDHFVDQEVKAGADAVLNLACGLDSRPFRLALPPSLRWIEVDLPPLLAYKESILAGEKPVCQLERIALDLSDVSARRNLFSRIAAENKKVLVMTEGLLVYLEREAVLALGKDIAANGSMQRWIVDLQSPGLLKMLQKKMGDQMAATPMKFAPPEGPDFFLQCGWRPLEVRTLMKTAAKLNRLSFIMRLFARLPEPKVAGNRPWGGICLLGRAQ